MNVHRDLDQFTKEHFQDLRKLLTILNAMVRDSSTWDSALHVTPA